MEDEIKFYVVEVSTGDEKIAGKGMYEYDTLDEAVASWHQKMSTAMHSALYTSELCMVINSDGGKYDDYTEKWVRKVAK